MEMEVEGDELASVSQLNLDSNEEMDDIVQPVAILVDELRSEETTVRVEAIKRLSTIALALGQERTRAELIPFLQKSLDDEDEVLMALAEELGRFVEFVGGPKFAHLLVGPLEGLASADETAVRQKAVASLDGICQVLSSEQIAVHLLPVIGRMANGDWFSKKTSAAAIIALVYGRLSMAQRASLQQVLASLGADESPSVRKAVLTHLGRIIRESDPIECVPVLLSTLAQLASDLQDSVRLLSVEPFVAICAKITDSDEKAALLFPIFLALASDRSWRIRFMLATHFGCLASVIQTNPPSPIIDPVRTYCALLRDVEPEVRTAAAGRLAAVAKHASPDEIESLLLPAIRSAVADASPHVKAALALQLNDFSLAAGHELTLVHVLPMIIQLLRDDSSEVRLNVISKMETTVTVVGIDQLYHTLLPAISKLSEDRQWRVRQTVVEHLPNLAGLLGQERFDGKLCELALAWLDDPVYAVRESAGVCLASLIRAFGTAWAGNSGLLTSILDYTRHQNYLRRQSLLLCLAEISRVLEPEVVAGVVVPVLQKLASDPIINIRFGTAKAIEQIVPVLLQDRPDVVREVLLPLLQQLELDPDEDVQCFAQRALMIVPAL